MLYNIQMSTEYGRGLYSTKLIPENTVIMECELLILNETDTKVIEATQLRHYTFKYDNTQDCIVLGDGELFNHDIHANVTYQLVEVDGRTKMRFTTLSHIRTGTQLYIDYNQDIQVKIKEYVESKPLVG